MGAKQPALEPKLAAVLARLCQRRGSLTKTQAAKLPYLVDVVAKHVLGKRITRASHENWRYGVVASEVWHFAKPGVRDPFSIEELPYSEGRVLITLVREPTDDLSVEEQEIVDFIADEFGSLDFDDLGRLTKAMNLEVASWGSNGAAKVDEEAYIRLAGRFDRVFKRLERCDSEDPKTWGELLRSIKRRFAKESRCLGASSIVRPPGRTRSFRRLFPGCVRRSRMPSLTRWKGFGLSWKRLRIRLRTQG